MKRRGFLGFLGGAVAAGPSAAKSIVDNQSIAKPLIGGGYGGVAPSPAPAQAWATEGIKGDWRIGEIARLKRLVSGQKTADELEEERIQKLYAVRETIIENVDCLRSLSRSAKLRVATNRNLAHSETINNASINRYLANLLREMATK